MKSVLYSAVAAIIVFAAPATGARMMHAAAVASSAPSERSYIGHRAKGIVESVDAGAKRMTIKHGPVPSLNWSARTTTFSVLDGVSLAGIGAGNEVDFEFTASDKGGYLITTISKSTTLDGRAQLGASPRATQ